MTHYHETASGWAVLITRSDGTKFFAEQALGCFRFTRKKEASDYREFYLQMQPEIKPSRIKVVRVQSTIIELGAKQ